MGQLLSFEDHALARLRERVAAAEEAREDLLAFARGQSGAVAAIHQAVLAALDATDFDHLLHVVVQEWPLILGLDAVDLCPICGSPSFICQDPDLEYAWDVLPPVRCHRKTRLAEAQRKITEETNPVPEALLWRTALKSGVR